VSWEKLSPGKVSEGGKCPGETVRSPEKRQAGDLVPFFVSSHQTQQIAYVRLHEMIAYHFRISSRYICRILSISWAKIYILVLCEL